MDQIPTILQKYVAIGDDTKDKLLGAEFMVISKDVSLRLMQGPQLQVSAGRVDVPQDSSPFDQDTFTFVASMTKLVSATAIMLAVERGLLNLDDDMRSVVPELGRLQILRGFDDKDQPILEDNAVPITLRTLLTHCAGLGYDLAHPDLMKWSKFVGRTATSADISLDGYSVPFKFTPGQGFCYGPALDFAGQALERVTGKTLGQFMAENIWKPLGMNTTTFRYDTFGDKVSHRTAGTVFRTETGALVSGEFPLNRHPTIDGAGAGLYTTASDYAKVLQDLLRSSAGLGGILKKETVDEMFRPQLNEVQRQSLMAEAYAPEWHAALVPEFSKDLPLDHGISGVINMKDEPGKRKKGSMMWSGLANSHWWIDRESGIAGLLFVNVLPHGDKVAIKLYDELERAVYGDGQLVSK